MLRKNKSLSHLCISNNDWFRFSSDSRVMLQFSAALEVNDTLEELDLDGNVMSYIKTVAVRAFAAAMRKNSTLSVLHLPCGIVDDSMEPDRDASTEIQEDSNAVAAWIELANAKYKFVPSPKDLRVES